MEKKMSILFRKYNKYTYILYIIIIGWSTSLKFRNSAGKSLKQIEVLKQFYAILAVLIAFLLGSYKDAVGLLDCMLQVL